MSLNEKIFKKFARNNQDTGSTEIQVALLTEKINYLKKHFSIHKKDYHSQNGLLRMVSRRRKLINYLKYKDPIKYNTLIKSLGIRR